MRDNRLHAIFNVLSERHEDGRPALADREHRLLELIHRN